MAVINYCILIQISLKFILNSPIEKYVSIGWDKGLAPNRRQAIILTNDDTAKGLVNTLRQGLNGGN